ncbi:MAG: hypothetical protein LBM12_00385 [Candidatus Nomurabacteria bacterium]|jgi:hypothetical protein|nr:hypothetical protein [Candidatus Nomurabacteria bacterium]
MKKWAQISVLAGFFLLITAVIWSVAVGRPVWQEFIDACSGENGCQVLIGQ